MVLIRFKTEGYHEYEHIPLPFLVLNYYYYLQLLRDDPNA
jgi:hypothetical protein